MLQSEIIQNNKEATMRWEKLQEKYQSWLNKLQNDAEVIQSMNSKIRDLKDINNEMDSEWSKKYSNTVKQYELDIEQLTSEKQKLTDKLIKQKDEAVLDVKNETKNDLISVEKHFKRQLNDEKSRYKELKVQFEDNKGTFKSISILYL